MTNHISVAARSRIARASVACPLAALVLLAAATSQAVPLSARPSGPGIHYFGYFGGAFEGVGVPSDNCPSGDYTQCVKDHTNIVNIVGVLPGQPNWVASWIAKLEEARALGMGAVLSVQFLFTWDASFNWDPSIPSTDPRVWGNWDQLAAAIVAGGYENTIVAFEIFDEPTPSPDMLRMTGVVAQRVVQQFPGSHRFLSFQSVHVDAGGWIIPNGVDWVGYDSYTPPGSFEHSSGAGYHSLAFYLGRLKTIVRESNQYYQTQGQPTTDFKLVLFPAAWETLSSDAPDTSVEAQAAILSRVEREISMAENDPDFVMIMPFLWQSDHGTFSPPFVGVGVNQLPMLRTYYHAAGLRFTTGTARLAYPSSITASSSYGSSSPNRAFDFNAATAWNSGQYAPGPLLVAAFADPLVISKLVMVAAQSPSGPVQHTVTGHALDGSASVLASFAGSMSDGQIWTWNAPAGQPPVVALDWTTQASPSWVGWSTTDVWTTGTTRLYAYPIAESGTYGGADVRPEFISDGDPNTLWNSGGFGSDSAPQWIILDLGQSQVVSRIDLVAAQAPAGTTTHTIRGGLTSDRAQMSVLQTRTSYTADGSWLSFTGPFANVRYLAIETTASPSWVGWREVQLYK